MKRNDFRIPVIHQLEQGLSPQSETKDYYFLDYGGDFLEQQSADGNGVVVYVCDTGIDVNHKDFEGVNFDFERSKSFVPNENEYIDQNFHGTFCTGIIVAQKNGVGVVGIAKNSEIIAHKVLSSGGFGSYTWITNSAKAILEDARIRTGKRFVINYSLGGGSGFAELERVFEELAALPNVIIVAAAGNSGRNTTDIDFPARYKSTIAVGAVDRNKNIASFSSAGLSGDVCGAGVQVLSTSLQNSYARASGTSFSTPQVTAIVAAVWSKFKQLSSKQIIDCLYKTVKDLGEEGLDRDYFLGVVETKAFFERAKALSEGEDEGGDKENIIKANIQLEVEGKYYEF
ncbi:MAG: S8 family serine peptidase [Saprospiraceae bacterium]|nr:S8 family serine peptidase [Saprospiraceae bacterium]